MCFELLGYDIFIDEKGKPNLLEINHLPSLNSDTEIDRDIKDALLKDTLWLLNVNKQSKAFKKAALKREARERMIYAKYTPFNDSKFEMLRQQLDEFQDQNLGNYEVIYPDGKNSTYDRIVKIAIKQFNLLCQHPRDKLKLEIKQKKKALKDKNPKTPKYQIKKKKKDRHSVTLRRPCSKQKLTV